MRTVIKHMRPITLEQKNYYRDQVHFYTRNLSGTPGTKKMCARNFLNGAPSSPISTNRQPASVFIYHGEQQSQPVDQPASRLKVSYPETMPLLDNAQRLAYKILGYFSESPQERKSRKTAVRLVSRLQEELTPATVEEVKSWLENNPRGSKFRSVIRTLLEVAGTEKVIDFCLELARKHPEQADSVLDKLLYYSPTERVLRAVEERLKHPSNKHERSYLFRQYVNQLPLSVARRKSLDWIHAEPDQSGVGDSLCFLIEHFPEDVNLAYSWLKSHKSSRERLDVVAALIKNGDKSALDMAKNDLAMKHEKTTAIYDMRCAFYINIFKAIAISFPNEFQAKWMQDWLHENTEGTGLVILGSSLLSRGRKTPDQAVAFAKQILELRPNEKMSRHIITGLMDARGDQESIALGKKSLRSDPNNVSLMCVLLRAVTDNETISAAKNWLKHHPKDPEAVFLLNHLSQISDDDEILKYLKVWLKANPNNANLPGVLAYYVRARRDQDLIDLTKNYLQKELLHEQFVWLIRSLLKITPEDPFAVSKAKAWLNKNVLYSERGVKPSLTNEGKVLSALLDTQPDNDIVEKSKIWLSRNPTDSNEKISTRIREKLAKHGHIVT